LTTDPKEFRAALVLTALNQPIDPFLDYAIWLSINDLAQPWLNAIQSGAWKVDGREKQLEFGLKAIEPALAQTVFEKVFAGKIIPRDGGPWIELIGQSGGPNQLRQLFDQLLANGFEETAAVRGFNALSEAARLRNVKPSGDLETLENFFSNSNETISANAIKLAGDWKISKFVPSLLKIAGEKSVATNIHSAAFASLREIGGEEVFDALLKLADKDHEPKIRQESVTALAALNLEKAMPQILDVLNSTSDEKDSANLWRSFLSIKNGGQKIAAALAKTNLTETTAMAGLKVAREGGRNEPELVLALTRAGNLDRADKTLTPEELKQLASSISQGDASRGEKVYRRAELNCVTCHAIGGAGGKVGPDLTSIGASAPVDYLIESVLFPNAKIKEGFHSLILQTKDEQEFSGIFVRETENEFVLRDPANKEISVPKKNIESRKEGGSLMPSGLIDNLSATDRADLFRFLTELGKPGPFDASKGNIARAWKLFIVTSEREQFSSDPLIKGDLSVPGWKTVLTTVSGSLAKTQLETELAPVRTRGISAIYLMTKLQLANAQKIKFNLQPSDQSQLWIDGQSGKMTSDSESDLTKGKHAIVLKLEPKKLPEQIRLETSEGTFLAE
ncbi:MAG: HEAT repeat domain-containing protein, partial [Limisphaerales bacterium]